MKYTERDLINAKSDIGSAWDMAIDIIHDLEDQLTEANTEIKRLNEELAHK